MSEKALLYATQQIKGFFLKKNPSLTDERAETMAREAVASIDWDNPALMHKGLNWIANDIYLRQYA